MQMPVQKTRIDRASRSRKFLNRFAREEDGVLIVFGVYVFLIILMVGGIGIDLMHFERERSKLQSTLDRAVLAAADLDQTLSPTAVVQDYFAKAGLAEFLSSVEVDQGLGFKTVKGTAQLEMPTQFMHMTGVDTLSTAFSDGIQSTAEERIDGVEISLVLDVSGSMNSNSRLTNLKKAARDFIDDMVVNTEDGKLSISIIPYATQVSAPETFFDEFNVSGENAHSRCINFETADFNETSMNPSTQRKRTMHFDPWETRDGRDDDPVRLVRRPVCEAESSGREMMIMQKDATKLKNFISGLQATGNTSIDIGMKWGTALIDPSLNPVITKMIAAGEIDNGFSALPKAYSDNSTLKVIVLMTDGQNTSQYYIKDGFREGNSNIWWNEEEERYSIYDPGRDEYFIPNGHGSSYGSWKDHAFGDEAGEDGEASVLTYSELWANTSLKWNAKKNYYPWMNDSQAYSTWYSNVRRYVGSSTKNTRAKAICSAAKDAQVIVFAIGFEAPSNGEAILRECASSTSHFFIAHGGDELSGAFASIASSIRKLRLTQ